MNADHEEQSHAREPERMTKEVTRKLAPSLGCEPVITVGNIEAPRNEPRNIAQRRDD